MLAAPGAKAIGKSKPIARLMLRVAQAKLHGRGCSRRAANHGHAIQIQRFEQASVCVSLGLGRCVFRQRCAQAAEPRHCNHPEAVINERSRELQALVEPASRAVY